MSADEKTRRDRIVALIAEIQEIDATSIKDTDRLREDLGMDSLGSLELLSTLSEELQIDLEMEEAMEISTVADACVFVERYLAGQGQAAGASHA